MKIGYLLLVNFVWEYHLLILSILSAMQSLQDEKWVIYCSSILKMAPPPPLAPPLHSYVYISYQAKHPLNFSNKRRKSANISEIQDIPNFNQVLILHKIFVRHIFSASTLLTSQLPQASERGTCIWRGHTLLSVLVLALALVSANVTGTQVPTLEETSAGARRIRWSCFTSHCPGNRMISHGQGGNLGRHTSDT